MDCVEKVSPSHPQENPEVREYGVGALVSASGGVAAIILWKGFFPHFSIERAMVWRNASKPCWLKRKQRTKVASRDATIGLDDSTSGESVCVFENDVRQSHAMFVIDG